MAYKFATLGVPLDSDDPSISPVVGEALAGADRDPLFTAKRADCLIDLTSSHKGSSALECLRDVTSEVEVLMLKVLDLQNLLVQFNRVEVWKDFLDGKICNRPSAAVVQSFERLRRLVLPTGVMLFGDLHGRDGPAFLTKLFLGASGSPTITGNDKFSAPMTYKEWGVLIDTIRESVYWRTSLEQGVGCRPKIPDSRGAGLPNLKLSVPAPVTHSSPSTTRQPVERKCEASLDEDSQSESEVPAKEKKRGTNHTSRIPSSGYRKRRKSESLSPPRRKEDEKSLEQSLLRAFRTLGRVKDVVRPDVYSGGSSESLTEFLEEFEYYFDEKYDGTEKQKAKLLRDFLAGDVANFYDAVGGSKMRYSKFKEKLTVWHKQQRNDILNNLEERFDRAAIGDSESLHIYAMRLEQLAEKIYPSRREGERQLRRKFSRTVPRSFGLVLSSHDRDMFATGREITWEYMKNLAAAQDRYTRDLNEYDRDDDVRDGWDSSASATTHRRGVCVQYEGTNYGGVSPGRNNNSRGRPQHTYPRRDERRIPRCDWCGRIGHLPNSCWVKLELCELCGSDGHQKEGCARYEERFAEYSPICPVCQGSHLGRDCTQALN